MEKIVYIVGCGRSGSTILDMTLGSADCTFSSGELSYFTEALLSDDYWCSCGVPARKCEFWQSVYAEWKKLAGSQCAKDLRLLQSSKFERMRYVIQSFFCSRNNSFHEDYFNLSMSLYHAICKVSGKSVVVDSSKSPAKAFFLSEYPQFYVIHLVRDGRGVCASYKKKFFKQPSKGIGITTPGVPVYKTSFEWFITNLFCEIILRKKCKNIMRIRYEDFVNKFDGELRKIGNFLDINYANVIEKIVRKQRIKPEHMFAGNRIRMSGFSELKLDDYWRNSLSFRDKFFFYLLNIALSWYYGYF